MRWIRRATIWLEKHGMLSEGKRNKENTLRISVLMSECRALEKIVTSILPVPAVSRFRCICEAVSTQNLIGLLFLY